MGLSIWHLLIVALVVLLVFGNRLPSIMGDLGKSIKNFKEGVSGDADKNESARLSDKTDTTKS